METGVLIVEDIAPARQGDVLAGCIQRQALAATRALARIHAASRSVLAEGRTEDTPSWQVTVRTPREWQERLSSAAARFPQFLNAPLVERLRDLPRRVQVASSSLRRREPCWIHGDAHLDNVLFRPDGTAVLLD